MNEDHNRIPTTTCLQRLTVSLWAFDSFASSYALPPIVAACSTLRSPDGCCIVPIVLQGTFSRAECRIAAAVSVATAVMRAASTTRHEHSIRKDHGVNSFLEAGEHLCSYSRQNCRPRSVPSFILMRATGRFSTSAFICSQPSCLAPPPTALTSDASIESPNASIAWRMA